MAISVVVCIKNEEHRIEDCLRSILSNNPDEVIVIDGGSIDNSVELSRKFTDKVIVTSNSNLTRDRQIGISAARNDYIAMIDADHRLKENDLNSLLADLEIYKFDIVQSQLVSFRNSNWLNIAEEQMWELNHNHPGPRDMIGVAPAIYRKKLFELIEFDDTITKTIDDTDFAYRLSQLPDIKYGIGRTRIAQLHNPSFASYMRKFKWYGIGDGEFCIKHRNRTPSMLYHLLFRYPFVYSLKALFKLKLLAFPYLILQGFTRGYWAMKTILQRH
ncbi:MAG: glycosyltransferase family 2 protein [Betaproteobacteria bacterium]|nr:glycosyltransferase family 2 protein [Betaproteobacteria bacterium]